MPDPHHHLGYLLTNQAIREHKGCFYSVHHLTRYSRDECLQGEEYINGHWFFFDKVAANNAIDRILARGWDEVANEDHLTLFQVRLDSDYWNAIPDDDADRWEIFNPDKFFRKNSPIKDQLQTKILREESKPLWRPQATVDVRMNLDQRIKDWLAARRIRHHGDAPRTDYAELGVFHGEDLWGEIRVTQAGGGSFHIEVLRGRFELDDFWTDDVGFAAMMDAALQALERRIREGTPEWSVHLL